VPAREAQTSWRNILDSENGPDQGEIVPVARTRPPGELLDMRGRAKKKEALLFEKKKRRAFDFNGLW
jgi:hypothetical protein